MDKIREYTHRSTARSWSLTQTSERSNSSDPEYFLPKRATNRFGDKGARSFISFTGERDIWRYVANQLHLLDIIIRLIFSTKIQKIVLLFFLPLLLLSFSMFFLPFFASFPRVSWDCGRGIGVRGEGVRGCRGMRWGWWVRELLSSVDVSVLEAMCKDELIRS